jgi:hypothetical protein
MTHKYIIHLIHPIESEGLTGTTHREVMVEIGYREPITPFTPLAITVRDAFIPGQTIYIPYSNIKYIQQL